MLKELSRQIARLKWPAVILFSLVMAFWRFGYSDIQSDLLILDLKGIYEADVSALRGDWFTESVPQPHWVYDRFVEFFETRELLPVAKMVFWVLTLSALGLAVALIVNPLAGLMGSALALVILQMGPYSPLGSGMLTLGWIIPHSAGAVGAILAFALYLRGYFKLAMILVLGVPLIHSQHGLHLGCVFFMLGLGLAAFERKFHHAAVALVVGLFGMVFGLWVAKSGSVVGLGDAYDRACEFYAPFHCYSSVWPAAWWVTLPFVILGVFLFVRFESKESPGTSKSTAFAILMIFAGYLVAMSLEYFKVDGIAHYVRVANVWRWIAFFGPLACFGYVAALDSLSRAKTVSRIGLMPRFAMMLFPPLVIGGWIASYTGHWEHLSPNILWITTCSIGALAFVFQGRWTRLFPGLVFTTLLVGFAATRSIVMPEEPLLTRIGDVVQQVVPTGEILMASPADIFLRRYTRRAVIADMKGIPYNDPYMRQWEERLRDLGGIDSSGRSYYAMPYERWISTARRYNANYAVVRQGEPRFSEVVKNHRALAVVPDTDIVVFDIR